MKQLPLLLFLSFLAYEINAQMPGMSVYSYKVNDTVAISLPEVVNYRREVRNLKNVTEEHVFRTCSGKNKTVCGFWENVKSKKKVASAATTYNKTQKALVINKMRITDFGNYMTGNRKFSKIVKQKAV